MPLVRFQVPLPFEQGIIFPMQPELFDNLQAPQPRRFQSPLFPSRFLRVRIAYEDLIFGGLSLVLVLLAGFCIGVERGKKLVFFAPAAPVREDLRVPLPDRKSVV